MKSIRSVLVRSAACCVLLAAFSATAFARHAFDVDAQCFPGNLPTSCFYRKADAGMREKVIVFIHGVASDVTKAWGEPASESFWPSIVVHDARFDAFDIYLVNYSSPKLSQASDVHEIAMEQLARFEDTGGKGYKEVYFIAHSMGGLVAKEMLTIINERSRQDLFRRIRGLVLLATPSQGADLANYVRYVSRNPQFRNLSPAHLNTFLKKLEDSWISLMDGRGASRFPRVSCAYETLATYGKMVVPRQAAATRCDGTLHPMNFNHEDIVKPASHKANQYQWAMSRVREHAGAAEVEPTAIGSVEGRWFAVIPEDSKPKSAPSVFSVEFKQNNDEVTGVIRAGKTVQLPYDRSWKAVGYARREFLALTYQRIDKTPAGIGNYFFIRNAKGDGLVGYVTGTNCEAQEIVRMPVVMLQRDNEKTAVQDASRIYPIHLSKGTQKIMDFRCPRK